MKTQSMINSLCLMLFCAVAVWAQSTTAALTGTVTDPQGAVIPGAKVTVTDVRTGVTKSATSNSVGVFFVAGLQPGEFTLSGEAQGFQKLTKQGVRLEISQTASVDFAAPRLAAPNKLSRSARAASCCKPNSHARTNHRTKACRIAPAR